MIVLSFYVWSRFSVGSTFIAVMLTILGYSINATIVIFDRIRENLVIMKEDSLRHIVNASITQTLTRSIYSSLTTFMTIFVLYLLGVPSVREFALPIIIGLIAGAYSSVCLTGPLWYVMKTRLGKNRVTDREAARTIPEKEKTEEPEAVSGTEEKPEKKKAAGSTGERNTEENADETGADRPRPHTEKRQGGHGPPCFTRCGIRGRMWPPDAVIPCRSEE